MFRDNSKRENKYSQLDSSRMDYVDAKVYRTITSQSSDVTIIIYQAQTASESVSYLQTLIHNHKVLSNLHNGCCSFSRYNSVIN